MPADNPLVGETWEMTDPQTGAVAQAVVAEIENDTVRLISRHARRLTMPRRSFLMTWRFVREAPAEVCAHGTCNNPAFLRVNDLGTWVMVCADHLPAWVMPLLPTDNPEDASLDRCPLCRASTQGSGSSSHETEGVLIQHCGSCDCYWVALTSHSDEEDPDVVRLERGIQLVEGITDTAPLLEQRGLLARGLVGPTAWIWLARTLDAEASGNEMSVQGVKLRLNAGLGETLVLIGSRPKTGIQRLGGTPDRQNETIGVPERGSTWASLRDPQTVMRISDVSISERSPGPGRQLTVKAHTTGPGPVKEMSWALQDFLGLYVPVNSADREPPPNAEPPPCQVGEEWITDTGKHVEVADIVSGGIVIRHEEGLAQTVPTYIFKTRYRKAPPRRSVYQRLMEDEE